MYCCNLLALLHLFVFSPELIWQHAGLPVAVLYIGYELYVDMNMCSIVEEREINQKWVCVLLKSLLSTNTLKKMWLCFYIDT